MLNPPQTSPRNLFPSIFDGVREIDELSKVENASFATALAKLTQTWNNQFIMTCDASGIEMFERVLGIMANPEVESLDFRRTRVRNRFSQVPPFTMPWLRTKFNDMFGEGNWSAEVDFANRILSIEAVSENASWAHEISVTITKIKPANLTFVNRPKLAVRINTAETISLSHRQNNYRLGVSWYLGSTPFANYSDPEVIKMASTPSIQPNMLNALAAFTADEIASVLVNDTYVISRASFKAISSTAATTTLEYEVPNGAVDGPITNVKVRNANGDVLAVGNLYVDSTYAASLKHTFTFKEGE